MRRLLLIFLAILFLLFQVIAASATIIQYDYSIPLVAFPSGGDPLGIDGGWAEVSFALNTNDTPSRTGTFDDSSANTYVMYTDYVAMADLRLLKDDGTAVFSGTVSGIGEVQDSITGAYGTGDSVSWGVDDLVISGSPYSIDLSAYMPWDTINEYPNYPKPFSFSASDVTWTPVFFYNHDPNAPSQFAYSDDTTRSYLTSGVSVPDASIMLLLGPAILGLAGFRRKRFKN